MKVTVQQLIESFATVKPGVPISTPMPILGYYYLSADENGTILRATNLEDQFQLKNQDLITDNKFAICIPKYFMDLLMLLPKDLCGELTMLENQKMLLEFPNKKYVISILKEDEYPEFLNSIEGETKQFKVSMKTFCGMLNKVTFALSNNDAVLERNSSVFVEVENNTLTCTGSEGTLLAHCETEIEPCGISGSFLLHKKSIAKIANSVKENEGIFTVVFNTKHAIFEGEGVKIACRLVNIKYPNYKAIVPQIQNSIVVRSSDIMNAVKRIGRIGELQEGTPTIQISIKDGVVKASATITSNPSEETINSQEIKAEPTEFYCSYLLLNKAIYNTKEEVIKLSWGAQPRPILATANIENPKDYYLIQPMRNEKIKHG